jgi:hypothetical protein
MIKSRRTTIKNNSKKNMFFKPKRKRVKFIPNRFYLSILSLVKKIKDNRFSVNISLYRSLSRVQTYYTFLKKIKRKRLFTNLKFFIKFLRNKKLSKLYKVRERFYRHKRRIRIIKERVLRQHKSGRNLRWLINNLMLSGLKTKSVLNVRHGFFLLKWFLFDQKDQVKPQIMPLFLKKDGVVSVRPLEMYERLLFRYKVCVELRKIVTSGKKYEIPCPVFGLRQEKLFLRSLKEGVLRRSEKGCGNKLGSELIDLLVNKGESRKILEEVYKKVCSNRTLIKKARGKFV